MIYLVGTITLLLLALLIGITYRSNKSILAIAAVVILVIFASFTLIRSIVIVSPGEVAIQVWFGSVQTRVLQEGIQWQNPMATIYRWNIRRNTIDFSDNKTVGSEYNPVNGPAINAVSADQNPLAVDVSFPYSINPEMAWKLLQRISRSDDSLEAKLLETNARAAVSDVIPAHGWLEVVSTQRNKITDELLNKFRQRVEGDLVISGFSPEEARNAFKYGQPQIREIRLDPKVRDAIAATTATEKLRDQQNVLTQIAAQQVEIRTNEGKALDGLLKALPSSIKSGDAANLIAAMAAKVQADAVMKAVEKDHVKLLVINGGGHTPVSVSGE
jgi:regulator of protease activity HflC (stomatin/prohibitin superfamily)